MKREWLPDSEVTFRRLFDTSLLGILFWDRTGHVLGANDEFLRIIGFTREDLEQGRVDWAAMTPPEYRSRDEEALDELRRTGMHAPFEKVYVRKDGSRVWVLVGAAAFDEHRGVAFCLDINERKRAEAALKDSEVRARAAAEQAESERRLLDTVLEAAPAAIIVADARGGILRMNPANERLWGTAPFSESQSEYVEWKGWWADGSERQGRRLGADEWAMSRALRGEVAREDVVEIEPFGAPGTRRTMVNSGAPVRDASGRIVGAVVAQMDITARVHAEEAVRRNEERYRLLGRATNDVIWDWDLEHGRVAWNDAVREHFGCAPDELGTTVEARWARIHDGDRARVVDGIGAAIRGDHESWSDEYRFRKEDGTYASILDRGYIMRDVRGQAVRMIGSMLDLTERRRTEAVLRESELFHRQVIESIPGLVFTNRPDGYCEFVNEQWVEFTGVPVEDQLGDGWIQLLHADDRERVGAAWRAAVEHGGAYDVEYRIRRRDGHYEWFKVRGRPIRDALGSIVRWFGTATNVHDLKSAEEALREAARRKDDFLAMLAHELRNPLAPVRMAAEILHRSKSREASVQRAGEVINRQVSHMARLVDDLLDVSRIARGKVQLRRERCDLVEIVRLTTEDYRPYMEAAGLALSLELPERPVWVHGDRTRLAQMLGNLLQNAGKFTQRGGAVRVSLDAGEQGGQTVIIVEDDGVGMDEALLDRLFDPFTQEDQGLARSQGGLGLGLALVKGLVELHGGEVEAHSAGLGRGSRFTVHIPLAAAAHEPRVEPVAPVEPGSDGLRVLVIEDNHDAAESLEMLLGLEGHRVSIAYDGPTGVEVARADRPDLVLCDLGLPGGMDGYAVAATLRGDPRLGGAYLVALSGYGQEEDRRRALEAGFDRHLVKPAEPAALLDAIASAGRARGRDDGASIEERHH